MAISSALSTSQWVRPMVIMRRDLLGVLGGGALGEHHGADHRHQQQDRRQLERDEVAAEHLPGEHDGGAEALGQRDRARGRRDDAGHRQREPAGDDGAGAEARSPVSLGFSPTPWSDSRLSSVITNRNSTITAPA